MTFEKSDTALSLKMLDALFGEVTTLRERGDIRQATKLHDAVQDLSLDSLCRLANIIKAI